MDEVFADTGYWIALISTRDDLRASAAQATNNLGGRRIVTSEMVLVEVLNHFARQGDVARETAAETIMGLKNDSNTEVIEQNTAQFESAVSTVCEQVGSNLELGGLFEFRADGGAGYSGCVGV